MKTCQNCVGYDFCPEFYQYREEEIKKLTEGDIRDVCLSFKDKSKLIELPCSIGDPYFTVERFCTEGGYHEEKEEVHLSDCEYCCEECDMELRIVEHKFHNAIQILQEEKYIGEYIFLTREEAEKRLHEINGTQ